MSTLRRILLTGGGTAGHVNPALAIGKALAGEGTRFLYVGVRGRAEATVVPREGMPIRFVRAVGYPGARPSPALFRFLFEISIGTVQALAILLSFRPDVIIGTGGFASAPIMFAAAVLRKLRLSRSRVYVHEQNAAPGKLNQLVGKLAHRVFVTFPETLRQFAANGLVTGYPLRRRIGVVPCDEARSKLDFEVPPERMVIFAFGGSQGARTINRAVVDALRDLLPYRDRLFIVHGTGLVKSGSYNAAEDTAIRLRERYSDEEQRLIDTFYVSRPFFYQIENVYALTNLVVARGGAGSLYELASLGLPAIVIPKANLPGDHQVMNARAMARCGGALVLYEEAVLAGGQIVEQVEGHRLAEEILGFVNAPDRLAQMGRNARRFLQQDALAVIESTIRRDAGELQGPAEEGDGAPGVLRGAPHEEIPSNQVLLSRLERAAARCGSSYTPDLVVPAADDRAYFVSRAASLLVSSEWPQRNVGVKLIGLLHASEKLPLLLALLRDKRPASFLKRMLGGDYVQVGFIRRNILSTIARLEVVTPEVEQELVNAFGDPYYEARAEAVRTVSRLAERLHNRAAVVKGLIGLLNDRWLEVSAAAAEALGRVGGEDDALPALLALKDARYWLLRASALKGILGLVERGQAGDPSALLANLNAFVLTSTDFKPEFQIKRLYGRLVQEIGSRDGGEQ